ncbi:hypothetical protein Aph01nite_00070 [Acrocarpospora phusangensis]|uniref:Uncharacterized protein n=1 Tax=Acrocarpospora phusangensis TaxID=1070424 RepID=A0A919Q3L1_9ACTN|nr:hypothetical protein [Acrocarpospora phusangensis]GIH21697.1 hypothetical protein Aph01nite_00070 [Acrocarpospora phusangensis]
MRVPDRLLEVREEFSRYRRYFAEFKAELQQAESIKRRAELLTRYRRLLELASGPRAEVVTAVEMLNFAETTVKTAADPASFSASLLAQPADWLRRWWQRRPLAVLFRLDGKLPNLTNYRELITKHWGTTINDEVLLEYARHATDIKRLMGAP